MVKEWIAVIAILAIIVLALVLGYYGQIKPEEPEPSPVIVSVAQLVDYSNNVFNYIPCSDPVANKLETSQDIDFIVDEFGYVGFKGITTELVDETKYCFISGYMVHTECILITEWYPDGHEKSGTYHYRYWLDPNDLCVKRQTCNYLLFPDLCPKCIPGSEDCVVCDDPEETDCKPEYVWVYKGSKDCPNYEVYKALNYRLCPVTVTPAAEEKYVRIEDGFNIRWIPNPNYQG